MSIKKVVVISLIGLGLTGSGVALAASVGGGTWNYGVGYTLTYGYSNYYHPTRYHHATVQQWQTTATSKKLIQQSSKGATAGQWANTSITKIPPTGLTYQWGY